MKREELKDTIYSILFRQIDDGSADELIEATEEIAELFPLPPAEGATDKFRDVLNEVQRYIETNGWATESEMKAIWNSLSCAITESEKRQPTAEGAKQVQRCPVCMGKGLVPNSFYATTSGIGSTTQTYLPEKCRTCNGAGVIILPYPKLQPTAEGAEEIIESIVESLGDPIYVHNHVFEIRPYTVEHKTEWWIFHKEAGSGEPLAQWLNKFATLHAQQIAEKMVEEKLREELIAYVKWYGSFSYENLTDEMLVDEYLKSIEK